MAGVTVQRRRSDSIGARARWWLVWHRQDEHGGGVSETAGLQSRILLPPPNSICTGAAQECSSPCSTAWCKLILMEPDDAERARWADRIRAALCGNGSLFTTLLPLLQQLIGPQPALPNLSASERDGLFCSTFLKLIAVFARPQHPLVLFVDDIQWISQLDLKLIQMLLQEGVGSVDAPAAQDAVSGGDSSPVIAHHSLLLIGAYRTNEVGPSHPLTTMLEQLRLWQASEAAYAAALESAPPSLRLHEFLLEPLTESSVTQLLMDNVLCRQEDAAQLSRLLSDRCAGNTWCIQASAQPYASRRRPSHFRAGRQRELARELWPSVRGSAAASSVGYWRWQSLTRSSGPAKRRSRVATKSQRRAELLLLNLSLFIPCSNNHKFNQ